MFPRALYTEGCPPFRRVVTNHNLLKAEDQSTNLQLPSKLNEEPEMYRRDTVHLFLVSMFLSTSALIYIFFCFPLSINKS